MSQFQREAKVMVALMVGFPLARAMLGLLAVLIGPFLLRHG